MNISMFLQGDSNTYFSSPYPSPKAAYEKKYIQLYFQSVLTVRGKPQIHHTDKKPSQRKNSSQHHRNTSQRYQKH